MAGGRPSLRRSKVPVVVKPLTDIPSFDALGATLENPARLAKAGVTLVLSSFDTHNARNLRQEAGNAISYGLDRDAGAAGRHARTGARLGRGATGWVRSKWARMRDVVVWSGDPSS